MNLQPHTGVGCTPSVLGGLVKVGLQQLAPSTNPLLKQGAPAWCPHRLLGGVLLGTWMNPLEKGENKTKTTWRDRLGLGEVARMPRCFDL